MSILSRILTATVVVIALNFVVAGLWVVGIEVYDQHKLKQACELRIPRDKVCIVAYHPVEIVEWSEGVERKEP